MYSRTHLQKYIKYNRGRYCHTHQGMPVHNFPSEVGDLFITFEVEFPRGTLSPEQATLIREALLTTTTATGHGEL
jgi:hypothetical protein